MLDPHPTPEDRFTLKLTDASGDRRASSRRRACGTPRPIAPRSPSRSPSGTNAQGMRQHGCVQCGDCGTGCNVGAKNSLDMNYLPLAWADGVQMFSQVEVSSIRKIDDVYNVDYVLRPDAARPGREEPGFVTASVVILAGGTMGSNAILLRSREAPAASRPPAGSARGSRATATTWGSSTTSTPTRPSTRTRPASASPTARRRYPVGAYIEGAIDFRGGGRPLDRRVVIEDIAHASPLANGVALLMLADLDRAHDPARLRPRPGRGRDPARARPRERALAGLRRGSRATSSWPGSWSSTRGPTAAGSRRSRRPGTTRPTRSVAAAWATRRPAAW